MQRIPRMSKLLSMIQVWIVLWLAPSTVIAQWPTIAHIQPDVAAPGMSIAVEILAHVDSVGAFGNDGLAPAGLSIKLIEAFDTQRVIVGIPVVSWQGRMIQVPFFVRSNAFAGPVPFRIVSGSKVGNVDTFFVEHAQPTIRVNGPIILGDNGLGGRLSKRNTLLVRGLVINGEQGNRATIEADLNDPDPLTPGNPRLLPLTILSLGPIRISHADLRFEGRGKNGASGGGGGGSGYEGTGGYGYTGGGSSTATSDSNVGSGSGPTVGFGGSSPTGALGGVSDVGDQGGGGGTGHPFGKGGQSGNPNGNSLPGGFGGGSAGGESQDIPYGGGGGAFALNATAGGGSGNNAGNKTGGRLLLPLAGGSGGGAGNSLDISPAGSGGGGGGALAMVSLDSLLLSNTNIHISGDSGTTGANNTAGGGGGSGGGFVASSSVSLKADRLTVDATGGAGGKSSSNGFAGGHGSIGISRFDGLDTCTFCALPESQQTSLSQRRLGQQNTPTIMIDGWAGSGDAFADDISIYYRNHHTGWVRVDTVAFDMNGKRYWKKSIPALNDSVLFVSAYQRVRDPRSAPFDAEPAWISTHVSHQIIRASSRPELSTRDTLFFPPTKIGRLAERSLLIRNAGEAALEVRSIITSDPFAVSAGELQVKGYAVDSVKVTFLPTADSCYSVTATLRTNAGDKQVVLVGCGIQTDERIQVSPVSIVFPDTRAGACDSSEIRITSIGADTATIRFEDLFQAPFAVDTVGKRTRLSTNEFEIFVVRFCPTDSGLFADTTDVVDLDKTIFLRGKGLRRILSKRDTVLNETVCLNYSVIVEDTIYNVGNEDILITEVATNAAQLVLTNPETSWRVRPGEKQIFQYRLTPSGVGQYEHLAEYFNDTELLAMGRFLYVTNSRAVLASVAEFYACANLTAELDLELTNDGSRSVSVTAQGFGPRFIPTSATTFEVDRASSGKLRIRFDPGGIAGTFLDTIELVISISGCEDTTISVILEGVGTRDQLVFSKRSVDFGEVEIDSCKSDSIFVANVCGPDDHVDPETLPQGLGFSSTLLQLQTLSTGDGIWVIYTFCPTAEGEREAVHRMSTSDGTIIDIALGGRGRSTSRPVAALRMTDASVIIGSQASTTLVLDSLSGGATSLERIEMQVRYDATLLRPVRVDGLRGMTVSVDSSAEGTLGVIVLGDITPGDLLELSWLGLLGAAAQDSLRLDSVQTTPPLNVSTTNGFVTLEDCFGLAGRVSPGGVEVAIIRPQPVGDKVNLAVRSKNEVRSEFRIRDAAGRTHQVLKIDLRPGDQLISVPCSHLPAGAYWLEVTAAGYRNTQSFWR